MGMFFDGGFFFIDYVAKQYKDFFSQHSDERLLLKLLDSADNSQEAEAIADRLLELDGRVYSV